MPDSKSRVFSVLRPVGRFTLTKHICDIHLGIYVKSHPTVNKQDNLSVNTVDLETIWIEIENTKAKQILCCCAYHKAYTTPLGYQFHSQIV